MAIQKAFELENGSEGNYIRISEVNMINGSDDCNIKIQKWKNITIRSTEGKKPMDECCVGVEMQGEGDTLTRCYNGLKALSDFEGAIDV